MCVVLALVVAWPAGAQEPQRVDQKFETRADLVLVDVTVVDNRGNPITDLAAEDFQLTVNGRARPVHTVQYVSTVGMKSRTEVDPRATRYTTNEAESSGRLLLFAVDENYLRFGANRAVMRTAGRILDTLAPGDLVGLARLPDGLGGVEFTSDHERVRRALERVTGKQTSRRSEHVRLDEADAFERRDQYLWDQVIQRECGTEAGFGQQACIHQIESEARSLLTDARVRTSMTVRVIEDLLARLSGIGAPVNVIFLSEGLYVGRDRQDLSTLARLAARARVTFHVVQPDESLFDSDRPRIVGGFSEQTMMAEGLEQLAGFTRGTFSRVIGDGTAAFERLSRELSGYYLLSFEPTDADQTVRDRRIRVEVRRRGVNVRSRATYDLPSAPVNAALPPEQQIEQLLIAPLPTPGLPIRVASYAVTNPHDSRVRIIVSAEIGEAARDAAEWPVGLLVLDKDNKFVVNTIALTPLSPAIDRGEAPRLLLTSMVLDPGEYTLRLAALGPDGRPGSVHHTIQARLDPIAGGALNVSDLVLSAPPATPLEPPRPTPSAVIQNENLTAMIELTGRDEARLRAAQVAIDIADSEDGTALVTTGTTRPGTRSEGAQRNFVATLPVGLLPPGDYVARVTISLPGHPDTRIVRPFRLETPIEAAAADAIVDATPGDLAPAPATPAARIMAPSTRFSTADVLRPEVVATFIDALEAERRLSDAARGVLQRARGGHFEAPPADVHTQDEDEPALAFVRGLAALQEGQVPQAAAWFQIAIRGADDFLGALFYLGATYAASGRDLEAVGAWQMSLIGDGGERAYPVLVDALLRLGDADGALEFIAEAPEAWPSDQSRWRRVVVAQAILGHYGPALELLHKLLQEDTSDLDLLFLAAQIMYRQHFSTPMSAEDRHRFLDYAARYEKLNGPQMALVDSWRRFVVR